MENPTVKNAPSTLLSAGILMALEKSDDALHLKELYFEFAKLRPDTPPHSVRGRLNEGIMTDEAVVFRHGEGFYSFVPIAA